MDLFENFSSKENLKKAFSYLKDETSKSTLPLDPIWRPAMSAITQLDDDFFEALQEYLRQNKYQPDKADYIYAQKDKLDVRPICVFSFVDRIIFQALLNPSILGNKIDNKLFNFCFCNRILGKEKYLKPYKKQWLKFCDKQIEAFYKGFVWRIEFDINTYYEDIHINTLFETLKEDFQIQDERLLLILKNQLEMWVEKPTKCGIPQGVSASGVLANAYLHPLDTFLDNLKGSNDFEYFRYNDDSVIMAKSADKANHIVENAGLFLRKHNLNLNSKTKFGRLKNTESIEELKFYNDYGELNETSKQRITKFAKKLPSTLRKLKAGKEVKKKDISSLKYCLKAGVNLGNPEMLDDLIGLITKTPLLIYWVGRYLGSYLSDFNNDFNRENKKLILSKYEKVWKIYSSNSLTGWTKFWLLKVLSSPSFSKNHVGFQLELDRIVGDPNAKFLRPLAFFYKAYSRDMTHWNKTMEGDPLNLIDLGFTGDDIKRHIRNSTTETEKAIYFYFVIYLRGVEEEGIIRDLIYKALQSKSPEIQVMGIFLVEKLRYLFNWSITDEERVGEKIVVESCAPILNQEIIGDLSRIYFKLPIQTKEQVKTKSDEFLNDEGKIAQNKLISFFGIPIPLPVQIVEMPKEQQIPPSTKNTKNNSLELHLDSVGNLWRNPKEKFCYSMEERSERHKIIRYLANNNGYQKTKDISSALDGKSMQSIRTEIGKMRGEIKKFLKINGKRVIEEGKKGSGYRINQKCKIKIEKT